MGIDLETLRCRQHKLRGTFQQPMGFGFKSRALPLVLVVVACEACALVCSVMERKGVQNARLVFMSTHSIQAFCCRANQGATLSKRRTAPIGYCAWHPACLCPRLLKSHVAGEHPVVMRGAPAAALFQALGSPLWATSTVLALTGVAIVAVNKHRICNMLEAPSMRRLSWIVPLWSVISYLTVYDISGNAIGYPVFFAFALTYMRGRNGEIAGSWREVAATSLLVIVAIFTGVGFSKVILHCFHLGRSWRTTLLAQRIQLSIVCLVLGTVASCFRVYKIFGSSRFPSQREGMGRGTTL